ncbi:hypothetical protein KCU78_g12147, partial [Aureobasidium melanogenum]
MATQSNTPIPISSTLTKPTTHSKAAIIGGAIGGTLFLLLILVAIFIPLFRQRRSCLDIALRRHCIQATDPATSIRRDSAHDEKIVQQHQNVEEAEVDKGQGEGEKSGHQKDDEEDMLGLEEMLRIAFPSPSRYELDAGGFVEGRANWEIKL